MYLQHTRLFGMIRWRTKRVIKLINPIFKKHGYNNDGDRLTTTMTKQERIMIYEKRIAFFITLILLVSLCSTVYAETRMQYCARGASDHSYVAHTSEWQLVQTYRENCTQHSNCVITIRYYRLAWRCTVCGYRTVDTTEKNETTHIPMLRSAEYPH